MKNYLYILLLILSSQALLSCETSDDNGGSGQGLYEQYGSPFQAVPQPEDATIYQVNIRAFSEAGDLQGVINRLDHIESLGVNVIYLMPIYPVGQENSAGGLGSPYAVKDYKAVSSEFGDLEDLRNLVDQAHERDMAVVLDFVANHTAWDNAWITEHPEWYQQDDNGNIIAPPGTGWNDVAQLDYTNEALRDAMIDAMSYWVYAANIDGFRMDAADFVPHSFWSEAVPVLENIKDQELLMLAEGGRTNHLQAGFDYIFGFRFFDALKEVFLEGAPATELQDANAELYENVYDESKRVVKYTTNHDVNLTDGTPMELFGGEDGSLAAFVVAAYMKSVPMIYNGQAIGFDERLEFFSKDPIDWNSVNEEMLQEYKDIIAFRNSSEAVRRGELKAYSSEEIAVFTMEEKGETVLVLSNLSNQPMNYILPAVFSNTEWNEAFTGETVNLGNEVDLAPYEYIVLN
jgi:glycosidase